MTRAISQVVVVAAVVCVTAAGSLAQQTATSTETKAFEVLAVDGNVLVVRLPEGTREMTVPEDFRFTVNGQPMSVRELRAGMKGTATITTRTTVTPVTVTEVKSGTVVVRSAAGIIVRTPEGVRSFSQSDVDKRGVKIFRDGKPIQVAELREGNTLTATIVTALPPRVLTEKEVQATTVAAAAAAAAPRPAASPSAGTQPAPALQAQAGSAPPASAPAAAQAAPAAATLPKTASSWPLLGLGSALLLAMGLGLTIRRHLVG